MVKYAISLTVSALLLGAAYAMIAIPACTHTHHVSMRTHAGGEISYPEDMQKMLKMTNIGSLDEFTEIASMMLKSSGIGDRVDLDICSVSIVDTEILFCMTNTDAAVFYDTESEVWSMCNYVAPIYPFMWYVNGTPSKEVCERFHKYLSEINEDYGSHTWYSTDFTGDFENFTVVPILQ